MQAPPITIQSLLVHNCRLFVAFGLGALIGIPEKVLDFEF